MPGLNLTRVEAEERSAHLSVISYDVTLNIVPDHDTFYSKSAVRFTCNSPGYSTFIDAPARKIISATLNGKALDTSTYDGESIFLTDLRDENDLIVEMEAIFSKSGEGLQYSVDPADGEAYLYSQGALALMRHIYACFDQPDLKATFALTAIVPAHWEVVSNTLATSKTSNGDGSSTWVFPPTPRLSTYINAFIAGPYHHIHDEYHGEKRIPLGIYCRKSLAANLDSDAIFKITKQGFAFFERVFGLAYPFEKYDQIAVVDFNWGAMENVGAVTFKEDLFIFRSRVTEKSYLGRANTILHEMAHMWFGNMVTMKWWDDTWLNESFAEWAGYLALVEATQFTNGWVEFNSRRKNWAYGQDQLSSTHPITSMMEDIESANANFDGITYAKGASVLQQFVAHIGRENFITGLQRYFVKHAFANTTFKDLVAEMEAASGRDLSAWATAWLYSAGVNTLRPRLEIMDGNYSSVAIVQEPPTIPTGSTQLRPHRLAVGLYDLHRGHIVLRRSVEVDIDGARTLVSELQGEEVADLLLINDTDLSYAKIRFDENSFATVKSHLAKIEDPLARALCWSAAWDMLKDAEISSTEYVDIALVGLPGETQISVISIVTDQLSTTLDLYTPADLTDDLSGRAAAGIELLMDAAQPGSDQQLLFARSFASLASTSLQQERILSLLAGELKDLVIDADLRWHFLVALATAGKVSRRELDLELERDQTTPGSLRHSFAISAMPTDEAKAQAWEFIRDESQTNSARVARMEGFHRPGQSAVTATFVPKYFEALIEMWNQKSLETATQFVELMFPIFVTTQETLQEADRWLETTGQNSPPGLRRLVSEGRDVLARALKVQAVRSPE